MKREKKRNEERIMLGSKQRVIDRKRMTGKLLWMVTVRKGEERGNGELKGGKEDMTGSRRQKT